MLNSGRIDPIEIAAYVILLLVSFPVHEFAHAWAAYLLGDDTARRSGRLTLNPLAHIDPLGAIMMLVAGFGWGKPVPVDVQVLERRSPAYPMLVALAGPMSNFFMAILGAIPFRLGLMSHASSTVIQIASIFILINLSLMLFNLLPIFPLDGEKVARYAFPPPLQKPLDAIRAYGPMVLLVVIMAGRYLKFDLLGTMITPPLWSLYDFLLNIKL